MSVNASRLLYPSVLVYDPRIPRQEAAIIDLQQAELSIAKVIHPKRLPPAVFEYLNPRTRISYYFEHNKAGLCWPEANRCHPFNPRSLPCVSRSSVPETK